MDHAAFLIERWRNAKEQEAIIHNDRVTSYGDLLSSVNDAVKHVEAKGIKSGAVCSLESEFSALSISYFIALIQKNCIIVPLTSASDSEKPEFRDVAGVEHIIRLSLRNVSIEPTGNVSEHPLLQQLRSANRPGLILFTSGSTGKSKAAVHDLVLLLRKFHVRKRSWRTIAFLLLDHIGGINTLLYTLSNTGVLIFVDDRDPDAVARAIGQHSAQMLPTSPTFLNLLLLSHAHERHDLSSLELVTYGTELMPESTLQRFHQLFPNIRLQQTYGLSELGIMRSKSKSSDSLWVKIGGEGIQTRVIDHKLEIKSESAMLGYLNAPSPFTVDGWFQTGDIVEQDGDYFTFLGRESEIINVGGQKVYPGQVEDVLQQMPGVEDVVVRGESYPILGQIVTATIQLSTEEDPKEFRKRMRLFCRDKLAPFKVPQKIYFANDKLYGERFKKLR